MPCGLLLTMKCRAESSRLTTATAPKSLPSKLIPTAFFSTNPFSMQTRGLVCSVCRLLAVADSRMDPATRSAPLCSSWNWTNRPSLWVNETHYQLNARLFFGLGCLLARRWRGRRCALIIVRIMIIRFKGNVAHSYRDDLIRHRVSRRETDAKSTGLNDTNSP